MTDTLLPAGRELDALVAAEVMWWSITLPEAICHVALLAVRAEKAVPSV